jgi:hypothetical protein
MSFRKNLEIENEHYEPTIKVLLENGTKVSEHRLGSRRTIYANNEVCGFNKIDYTLPISGGLSISKFTGFLALFSRTLYSQFNKNQALYDLKIDWVGISRNKNEYAWKKIKSKEIFYNVDLSSAYWQMAYKLGYINKKIFDKYMPLDDYKEAKRYCISFLARDNMMHYLDGRETKVIKCDMGVLYQVYENVRHELYNLIDELKNHVKYWVEYNIDGLTISEKYLEKTTSKLDELGLIYKVNDCMKIDKYTYIQKGKIRNF